MPKLIDLFEKPVTKVLNRFGFQKGSVDTVLRGEVAPSVSSFVDETTDYLAAIGLANYAVYRNVMLIAKIVGEGSLLTQNKIDNKWETVPDHPFTELMEVRPNPVMSQSFIWIYQVVWLLLKGEAYWMAAKDETGQITYMYPLPANRVEPAVDRTSANNPIPGYWYTEKVGLKPHFIDRQYVCYHRFPNPFDYWRGLSPLLAYRFGLKISYEAQKTDLEDYTNRLRLQHLLSVREGMSNRDYNLALEDLRTAEANGNRWRLIRAGDFTAKQISPIRGADSTWIYTLTEKQANGIYGIPDGIWSLDANRASSEEHRAILTESTVWPLMEMVSEDLTAQLVAPTYGEDTRVVFKDIRPKNRELDIKEDEHLATKLTYNEVRARIGVGPHPDPDIGNAPFMAAARVAVTKIAKGVTISQSQPIQTKPSSVIGPEGAKDENKEEVLPQAQVTEKKSEYRKWRVVTTKALKAGQPLDYDFKSEILSPEEIDYVKAQLKCITDDFPTSELISPQWAVKTIFNQKTLGDDLASRYTEEYKALMLNANSEEEFVAEVLLLIDAFTLAAVEAGASAPFEDTSSRFRLAETKSATEKSAREVWGNRERYQKGELDLLDKMTVVAAPILFFYNYGLTKNKANPNLMWVVGATEHCSDCLGNNGEVKPANEWEQFPQDYSLECGGFKCECKFIPIL